MTDPNIHRQESGIDAPEDTKTGVERLKAASHGLRGNVKAEIEDVSTPSVSEDSYQLMKHHGMYQQDDRDTRKERKKAGLDKDYSFMIRARIPGGIATPEQYLVLDDIASKYGFPSIRITTRQTIQFHGVGKQNLKNVVTELNARLLSTYGACGDVVRNVMSCSAAEIEADPLWAGCEEFPAIASEISNRFLPRSAGYYDIFIDDERLKELAPQLEFSAQADEDMYGPTYMPRKFKIGMTIPEDNCVDVFSQDLGIVAIRDQGVITGFNILVGGGLGHTHNKKDTYPRLATPVVYATREQLLDVCRTVIEIQRDFGNRTNRKRARLKYVLDELGADWFAEETRRRMGVELPDAKPIADSTWDVHDHIGWREQKQPGKFYVGVYVENGRIDDRAGWNGRQILRRIVETYGCDVRFTAQQSLLLCNIDEKDKDAIDGMLNDVGFSRGNGHLSALRRNEIACVALPTCGLALAESERVLPDLITQLEDRGHGDERINIRMSGCPNSCSRAPMAEIGLAGVMPGKYNISVGGDFEGTRLNSIYKMKVPFNELADEVGNLITHWKANRDGDEAFGDYTNRVGVEALQAALSEN